ncbi:MAG: hypothetical protein ABIO45_16995, partial [Burkholderiaceae bacterium]
MQAFAPGCQAMARTEDSAWFATQLETSIHCSTLFQIHCARRRVVSAAALTALGLTAGAALADISQSGEQRNMRRVGHTDLQGRAAYQPNVIVYPDGRTIAFVGTHGGSKPNPL